MINNVRILLIIERLPNRVYWGCTMGAQIRKKKNNGQEKKKRKNKKNEKKPHSVQRVCKKKDLGLVWFFFFFITQFPSLITLNTTPVWHPSLSYHHSIFFTLFVSPILVTQCSFFFSSQYPKTEPERKKRKKKPRSPEPNEKKNKENKKEDT